MNNITFIELLQSDNQIIRRNAIGIKKEIERRGGMYEMIFMEDGQKIHFTSAYTMAEAKEKANIMHIEMGKTILIITKAGAILEAI
ncbi:MAG: hypothetical protein Athens071426_411 [Parcubacteria group bacterium Athens0714_26]|nr:MAG: hypothetical protein Athens071426_411 [Parcubacteria group bacterium Athens0714_26]